MILKYLVTMLIYLLSIPLLEQMVEKLTVEHLPIIRLIILVGKP